jgi:hypothetical protein
MPGLVADSRSLLAIHGIRIFGYLVLGKLKLLCRIQGWRLALGLFPAIYSIRLFGYSSLG